MSSNQGFNNGAPQMNPYRTNTVGQAFFNSVMGIQQQAPAPTGGPAAGPPVYVDPSGGAPGYGYGAPAGAPGYGYGAPAGGPGYGYGAPAGDVPALLGGPQAEVPAFPYRQATRYQPYGRPGTHVAAHVRGPRAPGVTRPEVAAAFRFALDVEVPRIVQDEIGRVLVNDVAPAFKQALETTNAAQDKRITALEQKLASQNVQILNDNGQTPTEANQAEIERLKQQGQTQGQQLSTIFQMVQGIAGHLGFAPPQQPQPQVQQAQPQQAQPQAPQPQPQAPQPQPQQAQPQVPPPQAQAPPPQPQPQPAPLPPPGGMFNFGAPQIPQGAPVPPPAGPVPNAAAINAANTHGIPLAYAHLFMDQYMRGGQQFFRMCPQNQIPARAAQIKVNHGIP